MSGKRMSIYLVALVIAVGVFLWYRAGTKQQSQDASQSPKSTMQPPASDPAETSKDAADKGIAAGNDISDQSDQDFSTQCEKGEWVKIADVPGDTTSAIGILHWVDADNDATSKQFEKYTHYLDGKEKFALINPAVKTDDDENNLDLFQGREVEVQGAARQAAVKEMQVSQVRCTGAETDKDLATSRVSMLSYISENISLIAPEKAPKQKWTVDSAIILDEKDIYVDFYDTIEDSDNADPDLDTVHRVLLEVSPKSSGGYEAKVLAYYVPGKDDFSLKQGVDKFKNQDETAFPSYTYDSEDKSWTRD